MTITSGVAPVITPAGPADGRLPRAGSVLVVTARPGQESADLGGLLYAFGSAGTSLGLLCLEAVRPWELQLAATVLGISWLTLASYPDGGLHRQPPAELAELVRRAVRRQAADLLLVPDPAAGDPDETAACTAAGQAGVPVVARTWPGGRGAWTVDLGPDAATARAVQSAAVAAHESQAAALSEPTRRHDPLNGQEWLRWLVPRESRISHTGSPVNSH